MRPALETSLLNADAVKQPLAYEHEVDAAMFLSALDREPTETERLASAYYLQHRISQLTGNIAVTGVQVGEKVEEMVENIQNEGFLDSLVDDYLAAKKPQSSLAEIWKIYRPDMNKQPKIGSVLKGAVVFSPVAFLIDYVALGDLASSSPTQRIVNLVGGALLAGYVPALHRKHYETHQLEKTRAATLSSLQSSQ
jgi:hypothetical protein